MEKYAYSYILANKINGTLYIGVTADLVSRIWQHKNDCVNGFSRKYGVKNLVYYEQYDSIYEAIKREKQLKKFSRRLKLDLINQHNPTWEDLYLGICC